VGDRYLWGEVSEPKFAPFDIKELANNGMAVLFVLSSNTGEAQVSAWKGEFPGQQEETLLAQREPLSTERGRNDSKSSGEA